MKCFLLSTLVTAGLLCSVSCSSSKPASNENYISPYDKEFNPDADTADTDRDLPEDELLERAKSAYDSGLYSVARENWNKLREQYPSSYYATMAELKIGDTYYYSGDYATAITAYEEFAKLHPGHDAIPYSRLQLGNAHKEQYTGLEHDQEPLLLAIKNYKRLIADYPNNELALPARRALATCRELLAEHEHFIGRFYKKQGQEKAAVKRFKELLALYPETRAAQKIKLQYPELSSGAISTSSLINSSNLQAQTKSSDSPSTPRLISKLESANESDIEARARMLQPTKNAIEEQDISLSPSRVKEAEGNILGKKLSENVLLNCNAQSNLMLFVTEFNQDFQIAGAAKGESKAWILKASGSSLPDTPLSVDYSKPLHECSIDRQKVEIFSTKDSPQVFVLRLFSEFPAEKINVFSLDRPARVVLVLEK